MCQSPFLNAYSNECFVLCWRMLCRRARAVLPPCRPAAPLSFTRSLLPLLVLQAGVGPEMQGCTEKAELLKLAQEKLAAWEIRRVIRWVEGTSAVRPPQPCHPV